MGARILIIDDDESLLVAFRRYLGRNHTVETTKRCEDALARVAAGAEYDLIISDLSMPGMNGALLYEALLAQHREHAARVVFMTGGDHRSVQDFLVEVPSRCLEKPIDLTKLSQLADAAAAHALPRRAREA